MRFANVGGRGAAGGRRAGRRHRRRPATAGSAATRPCTPTSPTTPCWREIVELRSTRREWPELDQTDARPARPAPVEDARRRRQLPRPRRRDRARAADRAALLREDAELHRRAVRRHRRCRAASDQVDYEAELVVVFGRTCKAVAAADAWSHLAGVMCGQDVSDRFEQRRPPLKQFTVAKSYDTFGPTGPLLVTPDELADPDALPIRCAVDRRGDAGQQHRRPDLRRRARSSRG